MTLPTDPTTNFWESKEKCIAFKEEYESEVPSHVMQALYLLFHPASEYQTIPLKVSLPIIEKDFMDGESLDLRALQPTIDKIKAYSMSKVQSSLASWEQKLEERDSFITERPYDSSTYEMLDKMMSQTHKLWEQYFSIRKQLEKDQGHVSGDTELSPNDKGLLI